ncbi:hypothetical protein B0J14DRAFT_176349 [Halenospora varia]|nr:hypothetical protein B0J14DRAFT_176349 [Halenospora varia]
MYTFTAILQFVSFSSASTFRHVQSPHHHQNTSYKQAYTIPSSSSAKKKKKKKKKKGKKEKKQVFYIRCFTYDNVCIRMKDTRRSNHWGGGCCTSYSYSCFEKRGEWRVLFMGFQDGERGGGRYVFGGWG